MARRQTAGRGRQGRAWSAPPGNLTATLLLRPQVDPQVASLYAFVTSLAVAETLRAYAPDADIRLKWPNDVLLNGGKAAGILLESEARQGLVHRLLIGVGINLAAAPPADATAPFPPIALAGVAPPPKPEDALATLATRLAHWAGVLTMQGFDPVRAAWLRQAARLGEEISARLPRQTITGIFRDVDRDGALVLATETGQKRISAGDVFFPGQGRD